MGKILKMVNAAMLERSDVWLEADEAVSWGFADGVFDGNYSTLRATTVNRQRRERMLRALRTPIKVGFNVSYTFNFNGP